MSVLVIDIGNTRVKAGVFSRGGVRQVRATDKASRASVKSFLTKVVGRRKITGAILASVVPKANRQWAEQVEQLFGVEALVLRHTTPLGIPMTHPKPSSVGADRFANAVGATRLLGAPVVAIDIGTAMTLDVVDREKGFIGGVIAPGPEAFTDYMAERTAVLPRITIEPVDSFIGGSTEEAMQVAAYHGYLGMIREMLTGIKKELGVRRLKVVGTGGYADTYIPQLDASIPIVRDLTLLGLGEIFAIQSES
jgi:type III pantothenate kinase